MIQYLERVCEYFDYQHRRMRTQHTLTHTHTHTLDSPNNFGIGNIANRTTDHLVKIINLAQLLVHKMLW